MYNYLNIGCIRSKILDIAEFRCYEEKLVNKLKKCYNSMGTQY